MTSNFQTKLPQVSRVKDSESHTDNTSVCLKDSGGGKNSKRTTKKVRIATYNIRTMRLAEDLERLEQELHDIKWDILGICETRLQGEKAETLPSGHVILRNNGDASTHGVAILVNKNVKEFIHKMVCVSFRVIYIVLKLNSKFSIQVIHVYAPTSTSDEEAVEQLYEDITKAKNAEKTQLCIIIGDFNAKVGQKEIGDPENIGTYGLGDRNERGERLLEYLTAENLYCMNTFFKKPIQRKWTWKSPDGKTKNEIDFILTNKKKYCTDVTVLNRFDTGSDHRLVRATFTFDLKLERSKMTRGYTFPRVEDLEKHQSSFQQALTKKLNPLEDLKYLDVNELNEKITVSIQNAAKEIPLKKTNKGSRLSLNTLQLIKDRKTMDRDTAEYKNLNKTIRKDIRKDLRKFNNNMIMQTIEENKNMKILKNNMSTGKPKITKLKNQNGKIVTDRQNITEIIRDFYYKLYTSTSNKPSSDEQLTQNYTHEVTPEVTTAEIENALKQLKNKKSPGEDKISIEMLKLGGRDLLEAVRILINKCINSGSIPEKWKNAEVILLFKKGDKENLENYRPVSLLSHLYKLLTKIVTNRLTRELDFYQPAEQAGFRKGFSTVEHIQTIRCLLEKTTEYNIKIHLAFIDYKKAFDSVEIWAIMKALQNAMINSRYIKLLENIYDQATMVVRVDEDLITNKIPVGKGVRQGDTISPKLFTLALEDVFKTLHWDNKGIKINGLYLNHLRFADDIVLISENLDELESMIQELKTASAKIGLEMNINKTKILSPDSRQLKMGNQYIEAVDEYIYLGHKIKLGKDNQRAEIPRRIGMSWTAFRKLRFILTNKDVPINLKTKVYNTCVLPVTTYGLETMTLTKESARKLQRTQRAMERQMLGISLRDKIRSEDIRRRTNVTDILERVARLKWQWVGHVARQDYNRWTSRIVHWRPWGHKRGIGRPQKRWLDDIKLLAGTRWFQVAQDRRRWKHMEEAYIQQWIEIG